MFEASKGEMGASTQNDRSDRYKQSFNNVKITMEDVKEEI